MSLVITNHLLKTNNMKNTLKYLIKLLFVIILPLGVSISSIYLVINNLEETSIVIIIALVILSILSIFNAFFYSAVLSKTRLLPEIDFEVVPVIGLAFGYDRNRMKPLIVILLPFVVIEIKINKKFKK